MPPVQPLSRTDEAIQVAKEILTDFDKGLATTKIARKCEHLGRLMNDEFIIAYVDRCMNWNAARFKSLVDEARSTGPTDKISGMVQCMEDFKLDGPPVGRTISSRAAGSFSFLQQTLPDAEIFVSASRKKADYTAAHANLMRSIEESERVIGRVSNRLHRYVSSSYLRLRFGNIPESIFLATRREVDQFLAARCPTALERFAVAYEELAKNSTENWTNAALAVRRVLEAYADAVFPAQSQPIDGHSLDQANYVNRLWEHARKIVASEATRTSIRAELTDLGKRIDSIYAQSNKGIHAAVSKAEADRIVIRAYLLLADLIDA